MAITSTLLLLIVVLELLVVVQGIFVAVVVGLVVGAGLLGEEEGDARVERGEPATRLLVGEMVGVARLAVVRVGRSIEAI